jgi:hypothetical protein
VSFAPLDLAALLVAPPDTPFASVAAFRAALATERERAPIDAAILGGHRADRLGYAFAAGYSAALRRLAPGIPGAACLCVTEAGGAHPRAIQTTVRNDGADAVRVDGEKRWATLAADGGVLLVAASAGAADGRNVLRVVAIPADTPGVTLAAMPPTPFTPEIAHYTVMFTGARVPASAVLPGDGYATIVKPFRTVEDVHVCAAALAYLLAVGRRAAWPDALIARLLAVLAAFHALAAGDPADSGVHVALGGALGLFEEALAACDPHWALAAPHVAERWWRDRPLLGIAARAREQRLAAAFGRSGREA